jgi:hypothetical protein
VQQSPLLAHALVLATAKPTWSGDTLKLVSSELDARIAVGKRVPDVLLATSVGGQAKLTTLSGDPYRRI